MISCNISFLAVLYHSIIFRSYIIPFLAVIYHPDAVLYQSYIDLSSVAIVYPYRPWYISFAVYHYYLYNTFCCIILFMSVLYPFLYNTRALAYNTLRCIISFMFVLYPLLYNTIIRCIIPLFAVLYQIYIVLCTLNCTDASVPSYQLSFLTLSLFNFTTLIELSAYFIYFTLFATKVGMAVPQT